MATSDMYFFPFDMCPFYTNTVQKMLKQAINIGQTMYGSKLSWAEMAMGRRLLFAAKIFDSVILFHCLCPCQQNAYAHANRSFARL